MTTRNTYDPFGWRLDELADPHINPLRRDELLEGLLLAEAEELAVGRRHLTIIHGEPTDIAEAEALNGFYDTVGEIVATAEWSRLTGGTSHLTVTVAGSSRDDDVGLVVDAARTIGAAGWRITDDPCGEVRD